MVATLRLPRTGRCPDASQRTEDSGQCRVRCPFEHWTTTSKVAGQAPHARTWRAFTLVSSTSAVRLPGRRLRPRNVRSAQRGRIDVELSNVSRHLCRGRCGQSLRAVPAGEALTRQRRTARPSSRLSSMSIPGTRSRSARRLIEAVLVDDAFAAAGVSRTSLPRGGLPEGAHPLTCATM